MRQLDTTITSFKGVSHNELRSWCSKTTVLFFSLVELTKNGVFYTDLADDFFFFF